MLDDNKSKILDLGAADEGLKKLIKLEMETEKNRLKVKYVGGMDFHNGLTTGNTYSVIEENESQFIVNND